MPDYVNAQGMGAHIAGAGTPLIVIEGSGALLHGTTHGVTTDYIEAGTYMVAAAATRGDVVVNAMRPTDVRWLINKLRATGCDVNSRANELGTDLTFVWRRAFRYRAEREATANALRVRVGKSIETGSRCTDGGWTFDGTTLRFSREIATAAPDRPMPLVLRVKA